MQILWLLKYSTLRLHPRWTKLSENNFSIVVEKYKTYWAAKDQLYTNKQKYEKICYVCKKEKENFQIFLLKNLHILRTENILWIQEKNTKLQQLNKNKKRKAEFKHQMKTYYDINLRKIICFYNSHVFRYNTTKPRIIMKTRFFAYIVS